MTGVRISHLANFIKIIDAGTLSRAAEQLDITQPTLSQQLTALEASMGAQLVLRGPQGVTPTLAGRVLYRHAQLMIRQLEHARVAIQATGAEMLGTVSVGLSRSVSVMVAVPLLVAVRRRYPDISVHIKESESTKLAELLASGRLDMAILPDGAPSGAFMSRPLLLEDIFLVEPNAVSGPPEETVSMAEVCNMSLALLPRPQPLRQLIEREFLAAGRILRTALEPETLHDLFSAIRRDKVATLLPYSTAKRFPSPLRMRRVVDDEIRWRSSMCISDTLPLQRPAAAVFELLMDVVAEELASGRWFGASLIRHGEGPHEDLASI